MSKSPELLKQIVFSKGKDGYKWKELLNCLITFPEEIQSFKFVYIQELHQSTDDVKELLVDVIDYLMDYGNDEMRSNFALKVFVVAFAQTLKITKSENMINLILGIIKKWADNVNYRERYPNFAAMYNNLVKNNIQFPNNYISRYQMYVPQEQSGNGNGNGSNNNFIFLQNEQLFNFNESNIGGIGSGNGNNMQQVYPNEPFGGVNGNESINLNERSKRYLINDNDNNNNGFNFDFPQQQHYNQNVNVNNSNNNNNKNAQSDYDYAENVKLSLNPNHYPSQYTHIVNDLLIYVDNISLANQMMDNRDESDNDIIREIIGILRNGNNKLIQLVGNDQVHNEQLVSNILAITEDINRTMIRWEYFSIGKKPEPFLSVFVENNAKDDALHHQQQQQHQPKVPVQNQYQPHQQESQSLHNDLIDLYEDSQPSKDHPLDMFGNDDDDNFNNQHNFNLRSEQVKQMPMPQQQQQQQFDMFNFNGLPNSGFQGYPQEPSYNQQQPYPQHPSSNNNNNQMNFNQWDMNQFNHFSQQ